ncbi:MAG TPA: hypothetical protein VGE36_21595 [Roseateles sp.]
MKIKRFHIGAAIVLSTVALIAPAIAFDLWLRPALVPVLWVLAIVTLYLVATWPLRTAGHWVVKTLAALSLFGVGGLMLMGLLLVNLLSYTSQSLALPDGCRVDVEIVGGLGDTDLHVGRRCSVALLWEKSTPLLSDTEAVLTALRAAPPAADGAAQVAVTLSRNGKPEAPRTLRIPPR